MAGRINLSGVVALVADSDRYARGLVAQMLRGFGVDYFQGFHFGEPDFELKW